MNKPIITWGVFDGVHLGHKKLLHSVVKWAKEVHGVPLVLTFYEHPDKILKDKSPLMITSLEHRFSLLQKEGIKEIVTFPFSPELRNLSPEQFVRDVLVGWLQVHGIVVNARMRFGKGQAGDVKLLKKLCKKYYLHLKTVKPFAYKGKVVSSTMIRKTIIRGNLIKAQAMLGRPITLVGTIVHGSGRGRKLGFPTANLNLHHQLIPPSGVYAVRVKLNNRIFNGLTNIGTRPTFTSDKNPTIEVHILGFKNNNYHSLYGKNIEVELITMIRKEKKFPNAAELIKQIEKDKKYFTITRANH
jgi:riboflavin kinase/FMN adenylyltransferase